MKIFFIQTASKIDKILSKDIENIKILSFEAILKRYMSFGFISLFGIDNSKLFRVSESGVSLFSNVANSKYIQSKWASENDYKFNESNWQKEILAAQIEHFQPDVIYTGNYSLLDKKMKKYLPSARLYALWNASPIKYGIELNHFDIGLSFNSIYLEQLNKRGIDNTEYNSFYIDPDIKNRILEMSLSDDIDVAFVGRYSPMFKDRNKYLHDIYKAFKKDYNIQYYLLTGKRFKGLIPILPWKVLKAYNKPVFLEDMFKVFGRSKVVLNAHSNITGEHKGNMRVFEALGSGSFLLTDYGKYPENLIDGKDFVSYKNKNDLLDKIKYYLINDSERLEIANNGYEKVSKYYNTRVGSETLVRIFGKYL